MNVMNNIMNVAYANDKIVLFALVVGLGFALWQMQKDPNNKK